MHVGPNQILYSRFEATSKVFAQIQPGKSPTSLQQKYWVGVEHTDRRSDTVSI